MRAVLFACACVFAMACGGRVTGTDEDEVSAGDGGTSATAKPDGGEDAALAAPGYHDVTASSYWSTATTGSWDNEQGLGAAFDGRYVYFPSTLSGVVSRYDTTGGFGDGASWSTVDLTMLSPHAQQFAGAVFDGRFVYLVPAGNQSQSQGLSLPPVIARYDTTSPAGFSVASWSLFDTTTLDPNAVGFAGAVFDGRYIYFAPNGNLWTGPVLGPYGVVARYDTQAASGFEDVASWSRFDATGVDAGAHGFFGAVFDGRYVYFVPYAYGRLMRFDTSDPGGFTGDSSWSSFDTSVFTPSPEGFVGAAFDGRYLYLVPTSFQTVVPRYDTTAPLGNPSSWSTFDTASIGNTGIFTGAAFDGRYVYLVGGSSGATVRCDTRAAFDAPASWAIGGPTSPAIPLRTAVFDGRYVYLTPDENGQVLRFDARVPPAMPALPHFFGSFF